MFVRCFCELNVCLDEYELFARSRVAGHYNQCLKSESFRANHENSSNTNVQEDDKEHINVQYLLESNFSIRSKVSSSFSPSGILRWLW